MSTLVIGAGAVGLAVASCLLSSQRELRLVTRPGASAALRRTGITRTGLFGEVHFPPSAYSVSDSIADAADPSCATVLVCTKTFAAGEVAEELARSWRRFADPPAVVLFHNGWGSADAFTRVLPAELVFNASVITGFRRTGPSRVDVTVHAAPIRMGSLHAADPRRLAPLAGDIDAGGIPCEVSDDIEAVMWAKLLYNCPLNTLGALHGAPYGELAKRSATRAVMDAVVAEIFDVMSAAGHHSWWKTPADYLPVFYDELLPPTAAHESSMLQDLRAGRPTEIDSLCGAVVAIGERCGVAAPVNAALRDLVRAATRIRDG